MSDLTGFGKLLVSLLAVASCTVWLWVARRRQARARVIRERAKEPPVWPAAAPPVALVGAFVAAVVFVQQFGEPDLATVRGLQYVMGAMVVQMVVAVAILAVTGPLRARDFGL